MEDFIGFFWGGRFDKFGVGLSSIGVCFKATYMTFMMKTERERGVWNWHAEGKFWRSFLDFIQSLSRVVRRHVLQVHCII